MKKLLILLLFTGILTSCSDTDPQDFTGRQLEYELHRSSDFDYSGLLTIREMNGGKLEINLQLDGVKSSSPVDFPTHLHFGAYDQADAPIAFLLNPVSSVDLRSKTILGELSDGTELDFDGMKNFDGHIKVHLANEGPDYQVILVAGNLGVNDTLEFDLSKMAVCGKSF